MLERGLLVGLLAFQNDFISKRDLLTAFTASLGQGIALDQVLRNSSTIAEADWDLLSKLVERYLDRFSEDPVKALEQLSSVDEIRQEMSAIADAQPAVKNSVSWFSVDSQQTIPILADSTARSHATTSEPLRFRILRKHAEGGLGIVYVAADQQLRREVALKQIRTDRADDQAYRLKFSQEAEITGQLEHPGIVPIYALGADEGGRPYYAMRFIKGESLRDHIKSFHEKFVTDSLRYDGPELRQLLRRFIDVCEAIDYAHDRGVLHRDLKPGNIMLGKHGETLVVDWGLAKPLGYSTNSNSSGQPELPVEPSGSDAGSETRHGQFLGTMAYAPPEQLLGKIDELSAASDVYSLGCILYELLTGKPPTAGANSIEAAIERIHALQKQSPRDVQRAIPIALAEICRKAMRMVSAERYQSARELKDDVQRWLDDGAITAYREPVIDTAFRWMRRHQTLTSSLAVFVLAAIVIGCGYGVLSSQAAARESILQAANDLARWEAVSEKTSAAANRGDLELAIELLEQLRTDRGSLSLEQQLTLARLYFFNHEVDRASILLRSVDLQHADKAQTARHQLLLGDLLYGGTTQESEGENLLRQAVASGKLPDAEVAYANGLLAETPNECIENLRECLRLDAFHAAARIRLCLCYVLVGKPKTAIELSRFGKQLRPQDWRLDYIVALAHATSGRREQMEQEMSKVPDTKGTESLKVLCRLSITALEAIFDNADISKPKTQFGMLMELTPLVTEIGRAMYPLLAANKASDELATITPKLGWFGTFFDAIGKPELDTVGLTTWLTSVLMQGREVTYLNNLAALFPEHKFIQTITAGYHYQQGNLQLAVEACERAHNAEGTFEELDSNLMFYAAATLGSRETEVDNGIRTRADQRSKVAEWSDFLATTASKRQFDPSLELQVYIVWAVLLKNGLPSEALKIAERESMRTDLDEPQRNRWVMRAELSNECNASVSAFSDTVKEDPRFVFRPNAADTKVP